MTYDLYQLDNTIIFLKPLKLPNVITINGIKININPNDHVPPHVHAEYGEYEVMITIKKQTVLKGKMPKKQLEIVKQYIHENENYLLEFFYLWNPQIDKI